MAKNEEKGQKKWKGQLSAGDLNIGLARPTIAEVDKHIAAIDKVIAKLKS
jgi:hypothetical protein